MFPLLFLGIGGAIVGYLVGRSTVQATGQTTSAGPPVPPTPITIQEEDVCNVPMSDVAVDVETISAANASIVSGLFNADVEAVVIGVEKVPTTDPAVFGTLLHGRLTKIPEIKIAFLPKDVKQVVRNGKVVV